MKLSYQSCGELVVTFAASDAVENNVVKVSSDSTVSECDEGDLFCGVVRSASRDGLAASVQIAGLARVSYSGTTAPSPGYDTLSADGDGGVQVDEDGKSYLVLSVNTTDKTADILL